MSKRKFSEIGIDDLVRAEKLAILFRHSVVGAGFSLVSALLLSIALWSVQSHLMLIVWSLTVFLTAIVRLTAYIRYNQKNQSRKKKLAWEKPYYAILITSSMVWGVGSVVVVPEQSPFHQAVVTCFVMGLVAGVILTYSVDRFLTLASVVVLLFPISIWLLLQSRIESFSIGCAIFMFFIWLFMSTKSHVKTLHRNLVLKHELQRSTDRAEYLARVDGLTGLYNRRAFYEQLKIMNDYSIRHNESLAVIVMDIDYFKVVNDTYGHAAGDDVLAKVGHIFQTCTRTSDICTRLGGEEFAVLARKCSLEDAKQLAEKLRKELESVEFEFNGKKCSITGSFGVSSGTLDATNTLRLADEAMYMAKEQGRNRVVVPLPKYSPPAA